MELRGFQLDPSLLSSLSDLKPAALDPSLKSCINAHGLYNTNNFVLRLSRRVHEILESIPEDKVVASLSHDQIHAYSTYLHETIHWWQHTGSTSGLMQSLAFPNQTQINVGNLNDFL